MPSSRVREVRLPGRLRVLVPELVPGPGQVPEQVQQAPVQQVQQVQQVPVQWQEE